MTTPRLCAVFPRPFVLLLAGFIGLAPLSARGQFATILDTTSRFAGNSTGTGGYNQDTGVATATTLNVPSNVAFDSLGNLYISDTQNNCVRKVDTSGNVSTVAGLRVSGGPDTCNTSSNPAPTAAEGLLQPTGLAIDSSNTLYIADSQHNCVRSLASGMVDNFAHPALTPVAGTCSSVHTGSNTPLPDGLAVDSNSNLYISIVDSLYPNAINQVVRHLATDPATTICVIAGQHSTDVPTALCSGIASTVTLDRPAGLALDKNGNIFIADSSNNCVREIAGLTTPQTAVGQCVNDSSGSAATALNNPYGLAFSADGLLFISESGTGHNNVFGFNSGTNALSLIAGLPSGASGPYNVSQEGQAASLVPLNQPLGVTTDTGGNIYLADSQNNIVRKLGTNLAFPPTNVGSISANQTIVFSINQAVNLTVTVGTDYFLVSTTCSGAHSASTTCQVVINFQPTRPGYRYSALQLKDSISGKLIGVELQGLGLGPLSLLAPGVASTRASGLRTAIAVSTDSAGDAYVLEQGNNSTTADVLFYPAAGGAAQVVVAQGAGLVSPAAMAVDGAGTIYVANTPAGIGASTSIARFGADGSINLAYATGLLYVNAMAVDGFDDLFVAMGGSVHNITEIYAGGQRRVVAGSGSVVDANNVAATTAVFYDPSGIALGPNGIAVADAGTHYVYLIDNSGIIHIVAGNGTTSTTSPGVATGTGLLTPDGLAIDAAGDIYIADNTANIVYAVYSVISNGTNIYPVIGAGAPGYTGDHGPSTAATINAPLAIALDGSSDLFVIDSGNNALREVSYPVTSTISFGNVLIGTTSAPVLQYLANAGNASLTFTSYPFSTTRLALRRLARLHHMRRLGGLRRRLRHWIHLHPHGNRPRSRRPVQPALQLLQHAADRPLQHQWVRRLQHRASALHPPRGDRGLRLLLLRVVHLHRRLPRQRHHGLLHWRPDALHGPDNQRIGGNHHMQRGGERPRLRQLHRQLHLHLHQFVLQFGHRNNHAECHQGAPDGHRQQLHPPVRHAQPHLHRHHHRRGQQRHHHRHLLHDGHASPLRSGATPSTQSSPARTSPTTT